MARPRSNAAPRGIAPDLLISQVKNTAPYVFGDDGGDASITQIRATPPASFVRALADAPPRELSHAEYFRLCLSAHYTTCATLVPTDVDNQIRQKLWPAGLPLTTVLEMGQLVLASRGWDFTPLTTRASFGADGSEWSSVAMHGHAGEWFTVAAGSYAALTPYASAEAKALRAALLDAIADETRRHAEIFASLWRAGDGIGALRASASIAHNFGDLDRVIDMWNLPFVDGLRFHFYKLTASPFDAERKLRHQGRLWTAGELYKSIIEGSSMALENHRHFALRKPRALRTHPALRVPLGPFFDDWGHEVATRLSGEALEETIVALVQGAERMPKTASYARALHVIRAQHPSLDALSRPLLKTPVRPHLELPREEFERRWREATLALLEEIPGRA